MTTSLRTPLRLTHYRLLQKMQKQTGMPQNVLVERALEVLAENTLRDKKGRQLLKDIRAAEHNLRRGRTMTLAAYEGA